MNQFLRKVEKTDENKSVDNETVNKIIEVLDTKLGQLWQEMVEI